MPVNKGKQRSLSLGWFLALFTLTLSVLTLGLLRIYETLLLLFFPALCIALAIVYAAPWERLFSPQTSNTPTSEAMITETRSISGNAFTAARLHALLPLTGLLMAAAIIANCKLDNAAPAQITAVIAAKSISHGRYSIIHYNYSIISPVASPLPFSISDTDSLSTNLTNYQRIVPGRSKVTLQLHKGFLGLPWATAQYLQY